MKFGFITAALTVLICLLLGVLIFRENELPEQDSPMAESGRPRMKESPRSSPGKRTPSQQPRVIHQLEAAEERLISEVKAQQQDAVFRVADNRTAPLLQELELTSTQERKVHFLAMRTATDYLNPFPGNSETQRLTQAEFEHEVGRLLSPEQGEFFTDYLMSRDEWWDAFAEKVMEAYEKSQREDIQTEGGQ